ncbi:hypothetical protein CEXT_584581 [Caerostris extrusa]|uniref:Uncharacterized protein n=1 Tax=Caerostris extrusa TaxID=172846 RepID=A0AAV4U6V0_CAEEX|nr:hypothetical protein CEXT_584581 [Caerostris extrusa]
MKTESLPPSQLIDLLPHALSSAADRRMKGVEQKERRREMEFGAPPNPLNPSAGNERLGNVPENGFLCANFLPSRYEVKWQKRKWHSKELRKHRTNLAEESLHADNSSSILCLGLLTVFNYEF